MKFRRIGVPIAMAAIAAMAVTGCTTTGETPSTTTGGTITVAEVNELTSFNPNTPQGNLDMNSKLTGYTRSGFFYLDNKLNIVPDKSFGTVEKTSDDPLTVKYTLAKTATWSDGTPVTADDMMLAWAVQSGYFNDSKSDADGNVTSGTTYFDYAGDTTGLGLTDKPVIGDDNMSMTLTYSEPYGGTADEETGGYGGVAHLAERGWFSPGRVDHVIIPEPLNKDRICLGHRGVWWAEVETFGRIAHGSMPFLGDCAVRHMGAVIAEMEESLFPALAARQTAMPVVPAAARASTLNINSLHGGQEERAADFTGWPSPCVPDSCRMIIDRRFLAEEDLSQVKDEFRDTLERARQRGRDFRYEIRDMHEVLPTMTEADTPVAAALARAVEARLGRRPAFVVSPGTYDQKHIDRIGKLKNCVAYGPGILDLAHQPDEYVAVGDLLDAAAVMAVALAERLGGDAE